MKPGIEPTPYHIISSSGFSLRLTEGEHHQYEIERRALEDKWLIIEQQRRGIWASNQAKYVKSTKEFNDWDTLPRVLAPADEIGRGW